MPTKKLILTFSVAIALCSMLGAWALLSFVTIDAQSLRREPSGAHCFSQSRGRRRRGRRAVAARRWFVERAIAPETSISASGQCGREIADEQPGYRREHRDLAPVPLPIHCGSTGSRLVPVHTGRVRRTRDACEERGLAERGDPVWADWFTFAFTRPDATTLHVTEPVEPVVAEMHGEMNRTQSMSASPTIRLGPNSTWLLARLACEATPDRGCVFLQPGQQASLTGRRLQ